MLELDVQHGIEKKSKKSLLSEVCTPLLKCTSDLTTISPTPTRQHCLMHNALLISSNTNQRILHRTFIHKIEDGGLALFIALVGLLEHHYQCST